ncbi:unnamed protein product [Orchesella dallaii]|uniref:Uncharacterized protein n=1 Tax=Orchesella dallaii TaxID=48710 RepID=A0ABP1QWV9_9HEXA
MLIAAVRNCNNETALLMRHKVTSLLYACNNTKYHEILCYDTTYFLSLDDESRKYIAVKSTRHQDSEMSALACNRLELNIRTSSQRSRKFEEEVLEARKFIHRSNIILRSTCGLITIGSESFKIDSCMLNYIQMAESNRKQYYEAYYDNERVHLPQLNKGEDVSDLRNSTADSIKETLSKK